MFKLSFFDAVSERRQFFHPCQTALQHLCQAFELFLEQYEIVSLDAFSGRLVFERIKNKSVILLGGKSMPLPEDFTPDQVPESAKETCRNWFYKVASIRELIPRLYPSVLRIHTQLDRIIPYTGSMKPTRVFEFFYCQRRLERAGFPKNEI